MTKLRLSASTSFGDILLAVLLVSLPFDAFLTVWGSTLVGHYTILRLYPDIMLFVGIGFGIYKLSRHENVRLRMQIFGSILFKLVCAYALLAFSLAIVAHLKHEVTNKALFYGLLVDLRFVGWLFVAPVLIRTSGFSMSSWQQLLLLPLVAVSIFAVLQSTVLPHNFLSHFGYNKISTITPYQTINQDTSTIRAQSTLRGANQLGAYLVIGISLLIVMYGSFKQKWRPLAGLFLAGSALALSFSRSAWIGTIVAVAIGLYIGVRGRRNRTIVYIIVLIIILGSVAGGLALRSSKGVQDALLHVSSSSTARQTSNSGHATALKSGLQDLVREPLGRGPGTAGPASLYNTNFGERNSENYYLQIGQEYGWAGLLLFLVINVVLLVELYRLRTKSLACGLLVSGLGLIFVNLLSFAWSDPTVAYIWWGLAGVALLKPFKPSVNTIADKKKG